MQLKGQRAVVCGAGGFIGGHLVTSLLANGADVIRAVDIKPREEWYQASSGVENLVLDLKDRDNVSARQRVLMSYSGWPRIWAAGDSSKITRHFAC
jgi:nucleoside-diphosphate-sugar epimerase